MRRDLPGLPLELWRIILDYVANSHDSTLSDLLAATTVRTGHLYFKLNTLQIQGTEDPEIFRIGLNGRTMMPVKGTELSLAYRILEPFLGQLRGLTISKIQKSELMRRSLDWLREMTELESLLVAESEIDEYFADSVGSSFAKTVAFIRCTANFPFSCEKVWKPKNLALDGCSPFFICRIGERSMLSETNLKKFEFHLNDEEFKRKTNAIPGITEGECWSRLAHLIKANEGVSMCFHVTTATPSLALLLGGLGNTGLITVDEYVAAYDRLFDSPMATLSYRRIFDWRRLFVNGESCKLTANDTVALYETFLSNLRAPRCRRRLRASESQVGHFIDHPNERSVKTSQMISIVQNYRWLFA